ncbi:hypothetical protein U1Q18_008169 [Sarracenia purpurea var. burkii]
MRRCRWQQKTRESTLEATNSAKTMTSATNSDAATFAVVDNAITFHRWSMSRTTTLQSLSPPPSPMAASRCCRTTSSARIGKVNA